MLKVILAKIGISLFRYLPLEQIVAKLLTGAIRKLLASRRATSLRSTRPALKSSRPGVKAIPPSTSKPSSPAGRA
jgi:hypothetical protein